MKIKTLNSFSLLSLALLPSITVGQVFTADTISTTLTKPAQASLLIDGDYGTGHSFSPEITGTYTMGFTSAVDIGTFYLWDDFAVAGDKQGFESVSLTFYSGGITGTNLGSESLLSPDLTPDSILNTTNMGSSNGIDFKDTFLLSSIYTGVDTVVLGVDSATGAQGTFQQAREFGFASTNTIPEPSALVLSLVGSLGLLKRRR